MDWIIVCRLFLKNLPLFSIILMFHCKSWKNTIFSRTSWKLVLWTGTRKAYRFERSSTCHQCSVNHPPFSRQTFLRVISYATSPLCYHINLWHTIPTERYIYMWLLCICSLAASLIILSPSICNLSRDLTCKYEKKIEQFQDIFEFWWFPFSIAP